MKRICTQCGQEVQGRWGCNQDHFDWRATYVLLEERRQYHDWDYLIGSSGTVWSTKRGNVPRRLRTFVNTKGYPSVRLRHGGKYHTLTIHRMVLETFVGPRPEGGVCRHLNDDPFDNRLENLCWGTQKENLADMRRIAEEGRQISPQNHGSESELHPKTQRLGRMMSDPGAYGFMTCVAPEYFDA